MTEYHQPEHDYEAALLPIAAEHLLAPGALEDPQRRAAALGLLREGYQAQPPARRSALRKAARQKPGRPPPGWLLDLLRRTIGTAALHRWAADNEPDGLAALGDAGTLTRWLADPPTDLAADLHVAGLRAMLAIADDKDTDLIDARLGPLLRRTTMTPIKYTFDPRSLFEAFDPDKLNALITDQLLRSTHEDPDGPLFRFLRGAMSLDGFLPQDPTSQSRHIKELRFEAEGSTKRLDPRHKPMPNHEAYGLVAGELESIRATGNQTALGEAYFEELAFVARTLLSNAIAVPMDALGLRQRVEQALGEYVPGQAGGTLSLPPLSSQEGVSADLVADNIRAGSMLYAVCCLEELKLFQVLDRVVEVFMNGQLPIGLDNGGRALSEYFFSDRDQRLGEAARRMAYSRVLGVPGGEVSKEAPPNRQFQDLFLRFLASVSEYDRQRRIGDVVGGRPRNDSLSLTGEGVRKAGFDLAKCVSLYGYGATFFVAERLGRQVQEALRILSVPEILAAYGVQGPFQVIERVCASDFGGSVPNIVRYRTMAESGKEILDIVAAFVPAWLGQTGQDLFTDQFDTVISSSSVSVAPQPDIPPAVEARLMRAVEHWLTVNGIKDDQRARLGEPEMTVASPSIPTARDGAGSATFDQLRHLIASGRTPSAAEIGALLPPDIAGMVRM